MGKRSSAWHHLPGVGHRHRRPCRPRSSHPCSLHRAQASMDRGSCPRQRRRDMAPTTSRHACTRGSFSHQQKNARRFDTSSCQRPCSLGTSDRATWPISVAPRHPPRSCARCGPASNIVRPVQAAPQLRQRAVTAARGKFSRFASASPSGQMDERYRSRRMGGKWGAN